METIACPVSWVKGTEIILWCSLLVYSYGKNEAILNEELDTPGGWERFSPELWAEQPRCWASPALQDHKGHFHPK